MQTSNTTLNNVVWVVTRNYRLQDIQLSAPVPKLGLGA